jgi:subtilisin family serine protease
VRVTAGSEAGSNRYFKNGVWQRNEARGIRYAVLHGARVITIETLGYDDTPQLQAAVSFAVARGAVIVTSAAGFGSSPNDEQYPASLPGVVNVSYLVLTGEQRPARSDRPAAANVSVLLTAPANNLPVDGPGSQPYVMFNEESSLAWAAGTVALIKAKYPQLAPALLVRALAQSAQDRAAGGYSVRTGFGLINPVGALREAARLPRPGRAWPARRCWPEGGGRVSSRPCTTRRRSWNSATRSSPRARCCCSSGRWRWCWRCAGRAAQPDR